MGAAASDQGCPGILDGRYLSVQDRNSFEQSVFARVQRRFDLLVHGAFGAPLALIAGGHQLAVRLEFQAVALFQDLRRCERRKVRQSSANLPELGIEHFDPIVRRRALGLESLDQPVQSVPDRIGLLTESLIQLLYIRRHEPQFHLFQILGGQESFEYPVTSIGDGGPPIGPPRERAVEHRPRRHPPKTALFISQ
ncbi:hypothetical protein ACWDSJ_15515 [Nocardia sp. NPDC003482]